MKRHVLLLFAALVTAAALVSTSPARAADAVPVLPPINGEAVLEHTKVLASDAFEGRAPGTPGEEKTVAYLVEQLKKAGLAPGNPDGTWVQQVPLVGTTVTNAPPLVLRGRAHGPVDPPWAAVLEAIGPVLGERSIEERLGLQLVPRNPRSRLAQATLGHRIEQPADIRAG